MTAKINNGEWHQTGEAEKVTFGEILAACRKAGVLVSESVRFDGAGPARLRPHQEFFHQLGNGKRHGPFEHEDEAYEDAFLTYYLWPW